MEAGRLTSITDKYASEYADSRHEDLWEEDLWTSLSWYDLNTKQIDILFGMVVARWEKARKAKLATV